MPDPVATGPRYLEMQRRFDNLPAQGSRTSGDRACDMEVSMAAVMFRDLQSAGHIPQDAQMSDRVPRRGTGSASSMDGRTYEARMVQLIRDRDDNGRLDVDVEQLRESGIVDASTTSRREIDQVLTGRPRQQISDQFIARQDRRSGLHTSTYDRSPNARGRDVQRFSNGMDLRSSQDRSSTEFLDSIPSEIEAGRGEQVATSSINGATSLRGQEDHRRADDLLRRSGDRLLQAGERDQAARVYRQLQQSPAAGTRFNLEQRAADPSSDTIAVSRRASTTATERSMTVGQYAERRISQIEQHQRMERTLGREVDPHNVDDVSEYFQQYSSGRSTSDVGSEWQTYLQNHTDHANVTWPDSIPRDQRPGRIGEMMAGQPTDELGRRRIDCEGYSYLTDRVIGGIRDESGEPRFDVLYGQRPGHVIAGAFDRSAGDGFTVNNAGVESVSGDMSDPQQRRIALAREVTGGEADIVAFGETHEEARSQNDDGSASPNAWLWTGSDVVRPD